MRLLLKKVLSNEFLTTLRNSLKFKSIQINKYYSNQSLSMEMFLIRLLYIKEDRIDNSYKKLDFNDEENSNSKKNLTENFNPNKNEDSLDFKNKTISQIKNFSQKESSKPEKKNRITIN